jgi:hypothetical protein
MRVGGVPSGDPQHFTKVTIAQPAGHLRCGGAARCGRCGTGAAHSHMMVTAGFSWAGRGSHPHNLISRAVTPPCHQTNADCTVHWVRIRCQVQ